MPHRGSERRKREILDAALECFSTRGFAASTMADIRDRAGASTGSIYHHFKSKEQLAAELYLQGVRAVQQQGLDALLRHESTERGVTALVEAYLDWVGDNQKLAAFLFAMRHADFLHDVEQELARIQREAIEAATDWFRARMVRGELPNLSLDVMRAILYGPATHFATQWASGRADVELAAAKRQIARAVWAALKGMRALGSSALIAAFVAVTACTDPVCEPDPRAQPGVAPASGAVAQDVPRKPVSSPSTLGGPPPRMKSARRLVGVSAPRSDGKSGSGSLAAVTEQCLTQLHTRRAARRPEAHRARANVIAVRVPPCTPGSSSSTTTCGWPRCCRATSVRAG